MPLHAHTHTHTHNCSGERTEKTYKQEMCLPALDSNGEAGEGQRGGTPQQRPSWHPGQARHQVAAEEEGLRGSQRKEAGWWPEGGCLPEGPRPQFNAQIKRPRRILRLPTLLPPHWPPTQGLCLQWLLQTKPKPQDPTLPQPTGSSPPASTIRALLMESGGGALFLAPLQRHRETSKFVLRSPLSFRTNCSNTSSPPAARTICGSECRCRFVIRFLLLPPPPS